MQLNTCRNIKSKQKTPLLHSPLSPKTKGLKKSVDKKEYYGIRKEIPGGHCRIRKTSHISKSLGGYKSRNPWVREHTKHTAERVVPTKGTPKTPKLKTQKGVTSKLIFRVHWGSVLLQRGLIKM